MSSHRLVHGSARDVLARLRDWHAEDSEPEPLVIETSGSSGDPKPVKLSRAAMRASADATHTRLGGPGQWVDALSPSHVAGTAVLFRSVIAGTEPVMLDEHEDLHTAVRSLRLGRRYTSLVPTMLRRMMSSERELEALRTFDAILLGGAAIDRALHDSAVRAGLRTVATYGMSETCGGCVYDGVALDGVAVAISDQGRIRLGGPVLFDGYDGRPELTAAVLDDGWFLTSDLGRLDEDGRLQVLGRVDDVVISGAVNVPSPAVAARVREHPSVLAAEVVGVPDQEWGQRVVAVVVAARTASPVLEELRDFVSSTLPRAWAPRGVVVVDEVPLLPNGKVDRRAVETLATRGDGRSA